MEDHLNKHYVSTLTRSAYSARLSDTLPQGCETLNYKCKAGKLASAKRKSLRARKLAIITGENHISAS